MLFREIHKCLKAGFRACSGVEKGGEGREIYSLHERIFTFEQSNDNHGAGALSSRI